MWMDYGTYRGWRVRSNFEGQAVALKDNKRLAADVQSGNDEDAIDDIEKQIDDIEDN